MPGFAVRFVADLDAPEAEEIERSDEDCDVMELEGERIDMGETVAQSLALNLEANVIIRDRGFTQHLASRLGKLMCDSCNEITAETVGELKGMGLVRSFLAYHFTRRYPRWAAWMPSVGSWPPNQLGTPIRVACSGQLATHLPWKSGPVRRRC